MQIRPLYMHRYGGVYADLDSQAGRLISGWIQDTQVPKQSSSSVLQHQ